MRVNRPVTDVNVTLRQSVIWMSPSLLVLRNNAKAKVNSVAVSLRPAPNLLADWPLNVSVWQVYEK